MLMLLRVAVSFALLLLVAVNERYKIPNYIIRNRNRQVVLLDLPAIFCFTKYT